MKENDGHLNRTPIVQIPSDSETANPNAPDCPAEIGGVTGPEPTRFGDWEKNGRCVDF